MEKQSAGSIRKTHFLVGMLFTILFIFTTLNIPIIANAAPTALEGVDAGADLVWDSAKHRWVFDAPYGESDEDGIDIPENIGNDIINGTKTLGAVAPSYTYWAGDSHRCGVICYVIDITTNTRDTTYTPFILVNNSVDSNTEDWAKMVNVEKFFLRTGETLHLTQTKGVFQEKDIAPVLYSGDGWSSNGTGVESILLTEDSSYKYRMFRYWSIRGGLSTDQINQLAQDLSNGKKALAWETVSAQSLFTSSSPDSHATLRGIGSSYGDFARVGDTSVNRDGLPVKAFTTEYGFAKWVNKQGLSGLSGSTLNWKWFQATAGSMILEEDEAGIIKPTGNTTIGTITASEAATITNGYGILITKITLPPIHTYDSSKGTPGNTETPSPDNGTDGDCTIKKLYYTQELASDGTIITEAKDYHPYTQTSTTAYISIDTESGYEIEGWKTSTTNTTLNTKEQFNSITPTHTGTSSQEILLDQDTGEKYLYILYKKTEVNPNPPQPYDFQLQQSQITKRVSFMTPDANSTTQQLFTHNFTWTAPAPSKTSCTANSNKGHLKCTTSEHTHSDSCYTEDALGHKSLTCTTSEHTHTDSCYEKCLNDPPELVHRSTKRRKELKKGWKRAVRCALAWAEDDGE